MYKKIFKKSNQNSTSKQKSSTKIRLTFSTLHKFKTKPKRSNPKDRKTRSIKKLLQMVPNDAVDTKKKIHNHIQISRKIFKNNKLFSNNNMALVMTMKCLNKQNLKANEKKRIKL